MPYYCNECKIRFLECEIDESYNEICPECLSESIEEKNSDDDFDNDDYYENLSIHGKMCYDGMEREAQDDWR